MRIVKVNEYITLKLIEGKTFIFIKEEQFNQCKSLFLINPRKNDGQWKIDSIEEAASVLGYEEIKPEDIGITPDEEFGVILLIYKLGTNMIMTPVFSIMI